MSFPNVMYGSEEETLNTYTAERWPLGSKMEVEDGRIYRMAEAGGTALTECLVNQAEAPSADFQNEVKGNSLAIAAGVTVITGVGSTTGNGAVDLFKNGYLYEYTAAGTNPAMRIKSNTLITAGAVTGTITLYNPLPDTIAAATTISYIKNLWKDIVVAPTTLAAALVGVNPANIAADEFGWVQTRGPARVQGDAANVVVGAAVAPSNATAGEVETMVWATTTDYLVGNAITADGASLPSLIFLTLE